MSEWHRSPAWKRVVRVARPIIAAQLPLPCADCARLVHDTDKWQVGHLIPVAQALAMGWSEAEINDISNLGPSHAKAPGQRACNQIAGGRLGAARSTARRAEVKRLPKW